MPFHILPEYPDPATDARQRVHALSQETNLLAYRIQSLRDERAGVRSRTQELLAQYPHFAQARGRHTAAAILAVTLFLGSWLLDLVLLSPLADFMLDWGGIPPDRRLPLRIAFAFIWTVFGYGIGSKLGIGLQARQRAARLDLLPAVAYILAMPVIAYFVGAQVLEWPARLMLIPMTVVLSTVPVLSGYFAASGAEYLAFLLRFTWLKHQERSLEKAITQAGAELISSSQRLAVSIDEHARRFDEHVRPYLTPLAQELIQQFSQGNITVRLERSETLPGAPQPLPPPAPVRNDDTGSGPESATVQQPERTGGALGNDNSQELELELQYLRQQLAQRAVDEDSELRPPIEFTTRLS